MQESISTVCNVRFVPAKSFPISRDSHVYGTVRRRGETSTLSISNLSKKLYETQNSIMIIITERREHEFPPMLLGNTAVLQSVSIDTVRMYHHHQQQKKVDVLHPFRRRLP